MTADAAALQIRPVEQPSLTRVRLRDVDDQAVSLLGWEQEYRQLSPGAYQGAVTWCSMQGIDFFIEESNQQLHQSGSAPRDSVALALPLYCEGAGWMSGQPVTEDSMALVSGSRTLDFRTPASLSVAAIVVALDDLMRYASVFDCETAVVGALAQGAVMLPSLVSNHLRHCLKSVARSIWEDGSTLGHGNATAAFRSTLLSSFVSALAGLNQAPGTPARSAASHRRIVERAVEYMRQHAAEPIGVVDICTAVGVHSRVLQYCFNEAYGTTPMAYLRCLRLHQVRRDIKELPATPIGDIAARWGIWHLGRFAADYRHLFGELPSATPRGNKPA